LDVGPLFVVKAINGENNPRDMIAMEIGPASVYAARATAKAAPTAEPTVSRLVVELAAPKAAGLHWSSLRREHNLHIARRVASRNV